MNRLTAARHIAEGERDDTKAFMISMFVALAIWMPTHYVFHEFVFAFGIGVLSVTIARASYCFGRWQEIADAVDKESVREQSVKLLSQAIFNYLDRDKRPRGRTISAHRIASTKTDVLFYTSIN